MPEVHLWNKRNTSSRTSSTRTPELFCFYSWWGWLYSFLRSYTGSGKQVTRVEAWNRAYKSHLKVNSTTKCSFCFPPLQYSWCHLALFRLRKVKPYFTLRNPQVFLYVRIVHHSKCQKRAMSCLVFCMENGTNNAKKTPAFTVRAALLSLWAWLVFKKPRGRFRY